MCTELYQIEENNKLYVTSLFKFVPTAVTLSIEALGTSLASAVQSVISTMRRWLCNLVIARTASLKCEKNPTIVTSEKEKSESAVCNMRYFYS